MPALANTRHEIFALEVVSGAALASAYTTAGFKGGEYAKFNASKLKNRPDVKARINELLAADAQRAQISRQYLEEQLMAVVDFDVGALFQRTKKGVKLRPVDKLPTEVRRVITQIEVNDEGVPTKIEFADRLAAAGLLLKSLPGGPAEAATVNVTAVAGAAVASGSKPAAEVRAEVRALIANAEAELGLPPGRGGDEQRMAAILASGEVLPPDLYEAASADDDAGGAAGRDHR